MKKVASVGAGISGLYLANELNKNTEIDYKIFEKKVCNYKSNTCT